MRLVLIPVLSPILCITVSFNLEVLHNFKQHSGFRSKMLRCINLETLLQNQKTKTPSKLRTTTYSQEYWKTFKKRSLKWKVMFFFFFFFTSLYNNVTNINFIFLVCPCNSYMDAFIFRLQSGEWNVSEWIQCHLLQGE